MHAAGLSFHPSRSWPSVLAGRRPRKPKGGSRVRPVPWDRLARRDRLARLFAPLWATVAAPVLSPVKMANAFSVPML
jgi:hypothetical protein